ncbi:unnamed protein product, partial [Anisakis simplex]|uniref:ABC transmembrane type-1 domain-containing protein n=1 Tax=Anisakis simplex TaxID=6269 RepID=A0A0M3J1V6_ANISI
MFSAVVRTKILFFDKNPIGRILNRFSKDVGTMDDQVAFTFFDFFAGIMNFLGMILVTILINPAVFIPTLPLALLFFCLRFFYLSTSRDVKRIEATSDICDCISARSPLYSHISAVMQGLTTVRAFSNERLVLKQFYDRQDVNTSANALTYVTARWFGFTIDCLVAIFIMAVAYAALYSSIVFQSGDVALMLMYAIQLTGSFSWVMRQSAELQNSMISVERISKYAALPIEAAERKGMKPPSNWPSNGHLYFHNVSMRYEENTELVLRNIEADIQPREKIGIVGRTGAGKSSLLRALFRLTEFDGLIMIDGISTKSLILQELRKRISIIPQDPVLFIGSLRKNLDPFVEFTDQQLWSALDQV